MTTTPERSAQEPVHGRAEVRVRDALPADTEAIALVARRSWAATYAGLLPDEQIERATREGYAPDRLARQIADCADGAPRRMFLVAERAGEVLGFLHFLPTELGPTLGRLYVDPDLLGHGIGGALLDALHERLGPAAAYVLKVHPRNERAREFYRRRGFAEAGSVEGDCDLLLRYGGAARG